MYIYIYIHIYTYVCVCVFVSFPICVYDIKALLSFIIPITLYLSSYVTASLFIIFLLPYLTLNNPISAIFSKNAVLKFVHYKNVIKSILAIFIRFIYFFSSNSPNKFFFSRPSFCERMDAICHIVSLSPVLISRQMFPPKPQWLLLYFHFYSQHFFFLYKRTFFPLLFSELKSRQLLKLSRWNKEFRSSFCRQIQKTTYYLNRVTLFYSVYAKVSNQNKKIFNFIFCLFY